MKEFGEAILKFGVFSDTHITEDESWHTNRYFRQGLALLKNVAPDANCICCCGDLTQWGKPAQLGNFLSILKSEYDLTQTPFIFCSGNHDNFVNHYDKAGLAQFEERIKEGLGAESYSRDIATGPNLSRHVVVNGVHFICLNVENYVLPGDAYSPEMLLWFEAEMKKAAAASLDMPIMVFSHIQISNTIAGSDFYTAVYPLLLLHSNQLRPILAKYPQAIYFSGHLHYSNNGDSSIAQQGFAAVNCPPLDYLCTDFGFYQMKGGLDCIFEEAKLHPACMLVEVNAKGETRITNLDILSGEKCNEPWLISPLQPGKYGQNRRNEIAPPRFECCDLEAEICGGELALSFSAASSESQVSTTRLNLCAGKI